MPRRRPALSVTARGGVDASPSAVVVESAVRVPAAEALVPLDEDVERLDVVSSASMTAATPKRVAVPQLAPERRKALEKLWRGQLEAVAALGCADAGGTLRRSA